MPRATQMLAYHGRTALLLGPMPRRAIPPVANLSTAVRPLVDVSEYARSSAMKAAAGLPKSANSTLLETTVMPVVGEPSGSVRNGESSPSAQFRGTLPYPSGGRRGLI